MDKIYDSIVIGAGPAGVQAGLYIGRANKSVMILHDLTGSLVKAEKIENYYGVGSMSGKNLYNSGIKQLENLKIPVVQTRVSSISQDFDNNVFIVGDNNNTYKAKTIVLAMGKERPRPINFLLNTKNNISYCALCDGFFYKNKKIAVIGSSEFAFAEYNHLLNVSNDVTIFFNNEKPSFELSQNINFYSEKIAEINKGIEKNILIKLDNGDMVEVDGVFIAINNFNSDTVSKVLGVNTNNKGDIIVDNNMQTNIDGIFACGDIIGGMAQISKCVNDGFMAGISVINYLNK